MPEGTEKSDGSCEGGAAEVRTAAPETPSLPRRRLDWPLIGFGFGSLVLHAAVVAALFAFPESPRRLSLDMLAEENRFVSLLVTSQPVTTSFDDDRVNPSSGAHRGDEGQMGRQSARRSDSRYGIKGTSPHMSRERPREYAASGGILAALQTQAGSGGAPPPDAENALGGLMGSEIGDSFGYGGMGVRGIGRGGGGGNGRGRGNRRVGLGSLSTVGHRGRAGPAKARKNSLRARRVRAPAKVVAPASNPVNVANSRRPLPQNGVLASNFVGGSGVEARLTDLLDRGVMVDGANIRLEAFQERRRLPYPVPSQEAVSLFAEMERTRVVADGDRAHLQIALVARQGEQPARPHMDIRLILDRSGSMQGEKWRHAIAAAHALVNRLRPDDRLGLISYSDDAQLDLSPRRVGDGALFHRTIDELTTGGGTHISAALELARHNRPRRNNAEDFGLVVLISDGVANAGLTAPTELGAIARDMFDRSGVLTTTIGLGTEFDEQTMLTVAREGNGSYHFVRRPSEISTILQEELEARAQAVAQALRVRVVVAEGVTVQRVYGSRLLSQQEHAAVRATEVAVDQRLARELGVTRDRRSESQEGLRIHLGSFRRGEQHAILMELALPPGATGSELPVAEVFLEYKDLQSRSNEQVARAVSVERVETRAESLASIRRPVKRTVLAFQAGEALQEAASALRMGRRDTARRLLAERRELLEAAASLWRDDSMRQDALLIARYETVVSRVFPSWSERDRGTLLLAMNHFGDRRMR